MREMGLDPDKDSPPFEVIRAMEGIDRSDPWAASVLEPPSAPTEPMRGPSSGSVWEPVEYMRPQDQTSYADRMLAGDPTRFEDHPDHVPSAEEEDYTVAVSAAIGLLRTHISRSGPRGGRLHAFNLMRGVFEALGGENAAQALDAERSAIDEGSRERGGAGFLGDLR